MPDIDIDLSSLLGTLNAYEETFAEAPRASIRRPTAKGGRAKAMGALQRNRGPDSLVFDGMLGQGGMGTVHLAEQCSLGRHVAVKRLREDVGDSTLRSQALLSEGWIMGALEHPNIPPVHDAMLDETGSPMILLKRIEGDEWAQLMGDERAVRERFGESLLDWNLSVLDKVCNALSYAHSRRIVHRDLKPENVMLGAFGEVYVLDWGVAAALDRDPDGRLPFIGDSVQPAGTPCFMAPELLATNPSGVDTRTDVYLVGAVLHEVLLGRPPHAGKGMRAVVDSILKSEPSFAETTPAGLAEICRKAMRAERDERYGSVEELQQALRRYQRRRVSQLLTEEATERLGKLRMLSEQPQSEERASESFALFRESRFAFRQALSSVPDDEDARRGLAEVTELMVRSTLAAGQVEAAQTFARELEEPSPELLDELARQAALQQERRARLERLERHQDSEVGQGARIVLVAIFAAVMTGGSLAGEFVKGIVPSYMGGLTVLWQVALLLVVLYGFRKVALEETENNRLTFIIIATALSGQLFATTASWLAGFSIETTMMMDSAVWVSGALFAVLVMGTIYLPSLFGYAACLLIIAWAPEYTYYGIAVGNVVMAVNAGVVYTLGITPRSLVSPSR